MSAARELFKEFLGLNSDQELDEYMSWLEETGGDCAICGKPFNHKCHAIGIKNEGDPSPN